MTSLNNYQLSITRHASKALQKLTLSVKKHIVFLIQTLQHNPFPQGLVKLKGHKNTYRVRFRDYRVVYDVDVRKKVITISRIAHRREVYKD